MLSERIGGLAQEAGPAKGVGPVEAVGPVQSFGPTDSRPIQSGLAQSVRIFGRPKPTQPPLVADGVIAVHGVGDAVVHHLSPLGIAAAAGTCLVVDLDPAAGSYRSEQTVASLLDQGVRRNDLAPARHGVAVLANGGAAAKDAMELVEALAKGWPALVLRVGSIPLEGVRSVSVIPLLPEAVRPDVAGPRVYQALDREIRPDGPAMVIPPLSRTRVRSILGGRLDPRWAWVRAWRPVWEGVPWV